jgi:hypothetical protein
MQAFHHFESSRAGARRHVHRVALRSRRPFEGTHTRPQYVGKIAAPQVIPLVGTGEIDFGSRMVPLVISAIASGADLKVVAAGGKTLQEAPHMKYFVRKDSGSRTPKDLEGKTIGFNSFGA